MSSDGCIFQYFSLLQKLIEAREAAGGNLAQEKSEEFMVRLHEIYKGLSGPEQAFVEQELQTGKWLPLQNDPLRH